MTCLSDHRVVGADCVPTPGPVDQLCELGGVGHVVGLALNAPEGGGVERSSVKQEAAGLALNAPEGGVVERSSVNWEVSFMQQALLSMPLREVEGGASR